MIRVLAGWVNGQPAGNSIATGIAQPPARGPVATVSPHPTGRRGLDDCRSQRHRDDPASRPMRLVRDTRASPVIASAVPHEHTSVGALWPIPGPAPARPGPIRIGRVDGVSVV